MSFSKRVFSIKFLLEFLTKTIKGYDNLKDVNRINRSIIPLGRGEGWVITLKIDEKKEITPDLVRVKIYIMQPFPSRDCSCTARE
jgi:hypothetical protein